MNSNTSPSDDWEKIGNKDLNACTSLTEYWGNRENIEYKDLITCYRVTEHWGKQKEHKENRDLNTCTSVTEYWKT